MKRVRLTITLDVEAHADLAQQAKREGRSLASIVRERLRKPMPRPSRQVQPRKLRAAS
jgi:predicted HicB family RNase H-like nuclease